VCAAASTDEIEPSLSQRITRLRALPAPIAIKCDGRRREQVGKAIDKSL
jgi:hypothetical protein